MCVFRLHKFYGTPYACVRFWNLSFKWLQGLEIPSYIPADNARCDVSAVSVWNPLERAFVDIRVFHAPAPSNRSHKTTARMYRHHEVLKKTAYNARVKEVEKGVFTPLVFSTTGGMGSEAEKFYKRIAEKTAWRTGQKYHETIAYIYT